MPKKYKASNNILNVIKNKGINSWLEPCFVVICTNPVIHKNKPVKKYGRMSSNKNKNKDGFTFKTDRICEKNSA